MIRQLWNIIKHNTRTNTHQTVNTGIDQDAAVEVAKAKNLKEKSGSSIVYYPEPQDDPSGYDGLGDIKDW